MDIERVYLCPKCRYRESEAVTVTATPTGDQWWAYCYPSVDPPETIRACPRGCQTGWWLFNTPVILTTSPIHRTYFERAAEQERWKQWMPRPPEPESHEELDPKVVARRRKYNFDDTENEALEASVGVDQKPEIG